MTILEDFFAAVGARDWPRVLFLAGPQNTIDARNRIIVKLLMREAVAEARGQGRRHFAIAHEAGPPHSALLARYGDAPVPYFLGNPPIRELLSRAPDAFLFEHFRALTLQPEPIRRIGLDAPVQVHSQTPEDQKAQRIRVSYLIPEDDSPDSALVAFPQAGEPLIVSTTGDARSIQIPSHLTALPYSSDEEDDVAL